MKKFIVWMVLVAMIMTFPIGAKAAPAETASAECPATLYLDERIQSMANESGQTLTVENVKQLSDFLQNVYYLCELSPTGYVICDGRTGNVIEYSTSSKSPYSEINSELFYIGPTYYYTKNEDGSYFDILSGQTVSQSEQQFVEDAKSASDRLYAAQENYAQKLQNLGDTNVAAPESLTGKSFQAKKKAVFNNYLMGSDTIKALSTNQKMGYISIGNGVCGYIAAGLMLFWIDECSYVEEAINDFSYLQPQQKGFWGPDLTRELRSYGEKNSTAAIGFFGDQDICEVIEKYAKAHSLRIGYERSVWPAGYDSVIKALKENNKPVILFGSLQKTENSSDRDDHAVLAYGYTSDGNVIVHYGWSGYSEVVIQGGTFGSSFELTSVSSQKVPMTDVAASNWAYDSAQYCGRYQILTMENDKYNPNRSINRGEFIEALYKLSGSPDVDVTAGKLNQYTDISSSSPHYRAATWGVANGILNGVSSTELKLSGTLTREQVATFFLRYSNLLQCSYRVQNGPSASSFSDYSSVGSFAREAMNFCTQRYLLIGNDGKLMPKKVLTRAEAGQLIYNCSNKAVRGK